MKKLTILAIVLGLAALLTWLALRDPAPAGDARSDAAPPEPSVAADAKPVAPRARARVGDASEPTATPPTDGAAKARAQDRPVESVAEVDAAGVLTVLGPDDSPLAGVRVGFLAWNSEDESSEDDAETDVSDDEDPVDHVLRVGRMLETGADGRVLVPKFQESASVAVRHGELDAHAVLRGRKGPWTLQLRRLSGLRARVVDANGKPCPGVDVLLVVSSAQWSHAIEEATSNAVGVATFSDVSDAIDEAKDGASVILEVELPFAVPVRVPLDPAALPPGPVDLVLPATGSVRCDVTDDEGRPAPDGTIVRLAMARGADAVVSDPGGDEGPAGGGFVAAGACSFPWVGIGLVIEATVVSPDWTRSTATTRFAGPVAAGAEASVRLRLGPLRPVVTGRLVAAEGGALPSASIAASVLDPGTQASLFGDHEPATATTDTDGRFRFVLDTSSGDVPGRKLRIMRPNEGANWTSWSHLTELALVDLRTLAPGVDTDLGDIRVRAASVLVAGVVVDSEGKPVADATVGAFDVDDEGPDEWSQVDGTWDATTADDGSFRIEGSTDAAKIAVGVSAPGWLVPVSPVVAAGTTDVRVVLSRGGAIAGSVRVPAGLDSVRVQVVGEAARTGGTNTWWGTPELDDWIGDDGAFEFESVRPGVARVEIRIGWRDVLFSLDDVKVVAGETTRDPRLQNIDIAAHLRHFPVTVVDEQGRPLRGARVAFRAIGSDDDFDANFGAIEVGADGIAHVRPMPASDSRGAVEVVVACRGYRSVRLPDVRGAATATLRPAKPITIRVRLADETALPPAPFAISVGIDFVAGTDEETWNDPRSPRDRNEVFGKERVIAFEVFDPGTYNVGLTLWETSPHGASGRGLATIPNPVQVTVGEDAGTVDVIVRADPEALARALARDEER